MIQIDMQMPKCCDDCFALDDHGDYPYCLISQDQRGYTFNTREKKMPTCPLKAQEPRVMTLDEALGAEVNVDQCWLEVRSIKQIYLADAVVCPEHTERADIQRWGASDCQLALDLYGVYWRMWTSRPTDAQREAIPWN